MDKRVKTVLWIGVLALFIGSSVILYDVLSAKTEAPKVELSASSSESASGDSQEEDNRVKAPDFTVYDLDGNEVKLSDFLGQPVVLNFWASWCPPCKIEMPDFNKVHSELEKEVAFLMVDLVDGQEETQETGSQFIALQGYTFPVYYDNNQEAAMAYGIRSIPTTFFIDREGYAVTGAQGQISEETLRQGIDLIRGE